MKDLLKRIKLLKGLLHGDIAHTGPFYAQVDITSRCNLHCLCCRWHSPLLQKEPQADRANKDFPFHLFKKLCEELKLMDTRTIVFTGTGEPMLHPRIFDMISVAKKNDLEVIMFANGVLLNEAMVKSLIDSHLDKLKVTLWATSSEEYKKQYPKDNPKNFVEVINGLQLLSRLKAEQKRAFPFVELNHPINRQNYRTIDTMVELACKTGCNKLSFSLVKASGGEDFRKFLITANEEKMVRALLIKAKSRLKSLPMHHNINQALLNGFDKESAWEKTFCYIAWYYADIRVDGKVFACNRCDIPMGNLQESSFAEIWNNSPFRSFRSKSATYEGLTSMGEYCNCNFCCHVEDNIGVHQYFKWFLPFRKK